MTPAAKSTPILPRPHWIRGTGNVRLTGDGEMTIDVSGPGRVTLKVSSRAQFAFEGEARRRMPAPGHVVFSDVAGTLVVQGDGIDVDVVGETVVLGVVGRFDVTLDGRGEVETASGVRTGWGLHPRSLTIAGTACRESSPRGGLAA